MKSISNLFIVSILSGATTLGMYKVLFESDNLFSGKSKSVVALAPNHINQNVSLNNQPLDFTAAADKAVHMVVHVKNVTYRDVSNPIMEFFYGYRGSQHQEQIGTGSGVIISEDGYIVTNNHVVKEASEIEITLNNKKTYKAKLIGTDSKMDIALLKIDADEKLPYATFADSNNVKIGEWVLAVGNPYNLNSTVTAGIVSAKARNLDTSGIQSFIQTDAAVNPGNSGGALVNTYGELIGINTMISSQTGSYVGYSFAIPSNITRKIIEDLMEFGKVQRGILGVEGNELNGTLSKDLGIKETQGFYIKKINKNSGADKAGLKTGDIIVQIDNQNISSFAELSGYINTKRPKDEVNVTYIREGKKSTSAVILTKNDIIIAEFKGIEIENINNTDKKKFKVEYGVKIKNIQNDRLNPYINDLKGGIILSIGNTKASDVETVSKVTSNIDDQQSIQIELITTNGQIIRLII